MRPSVIIQKYRLFLSHSVYLKHLIAAPVCVPLSACCRQLVWVVRVVPLRPVWPPVPRSSVRHFVSRGQPVHGQHHGEPSLCFGLQLYTRWEQPAPRRISEISQGLRSEAYYRPTPHCAEPRAGTELAFCQQKRVGLLRRENVARSGVFMKICLVALSAVELSSLSPPGALVSHCHSILQVPPFLLGSWVQGWL